jgi:flagellar protein FliJ
MALSMSGHPVFEPIRTTYGRPDVWRHPTPTARKATAPDASVRSQATSIRRREFQAEHRTRRVALLERMIADFERTAADLDREILIEQQRANIHDPAHFAYPTYAKAAILRRDNLKRSADELRAQLSKAKEALIETGEALDENAQRPFASCATL